jgi:hypothetical protein
MNINSYVSAVSAGLLGLGLAGPVPAAPQAAPAPVIQTPEQLTNLLGCRAIGNSAERLLCFDREAAALEASHLSGAIVVVDQATVRQAQTRMFGLSLNLPALLGRGEGEDLEAIETTLTDASMDGRSQWTFVLADGSVWRQIGADRLTGSTRAGTPVRIRRGAMGSYLLSVNGSRSLRVQRER